MADATVTLSTALKRYPTTEALLSGKLKSPKLEFEFHEIEPIHDAFKPMAREQRFDVSEMAIFTFLQAYTYKKPIVLLPVVLASRFQHGCIVYNTDFHKELTPAMLPGKKVGVRAYTQTTGVWMRGILADDYGVDHRRITWVTFEDPHLAEYTEPANVQRAPAGKVLKQMLLDGEIDAAILGDVAEEGPLKHLIPDHEAAAQRWAHAHGGVPINHMAAIRRSIAESRPDVVREVYRMLVESRAAASLPNALDDPLRFGVKATRASVERMIAYSFDQGLISRRPTVDEVYAEAVRILGPAAD